MTRKRSYKKLSKEKIIDALETVKGNVDDKATIEHLKDLLNDTLPNVNVNKLDKSLEQFDSKVNKKKTPKSLGNFKEQVNKLNETKTKRRKRK